MEPGVGRGVVLVVEDDEAVGQVLIALLEQAGHEAIHVPSGDQARALLAKQPVDLVLSDVRMPGIDGLALLAALRRDLPDLPVILITAHGTVAMAVEAMKAGATDFITKPFDREEVVYAVGKGLARRRPAHGAPVGAAGMVGRAPALLAVQERIGRVARGTSTVLILGESGTGKELAARAVHELSPRRQGPFVVVHCAALPEPLLESELFGYEKGAFTGASQRKPGRVELAAGGTLFLDEIGDVPLSMQVKLLRVLQDRQVERLGATRATDVDVRFVAATHRDLPAMVREGRFREDLLYRLNVVPIVMPPLRERREDIPLLLERFGARFAADNGRPRFAMGDDARAALLAHGWPGNVRELANLVERLVVLGDGEEITLGDVVRELGSAAAPRVAPTGSLDEHRRAAERQTVIDALRRTQGNRSVAARLLGVSRRTLYNKLREHGID